MFGRSPLSPVRLRLLAPAALQPVLRSVIAELGPAFVHRATSAGIRLPDHLIIVATIWDREKGGGETLPMPAGYRLVLSLPDRPSLAELRHLLAHELGHALIGQVLAGDPVGKGLVPEYVAELLAWEIVAEAGLHAGTEVTISNQRIGRNRWLPDLLEISEQLEALPDREKIGLDSVAERRFKSRLFVACYALVRAEAYALAVEQALGLSLDREELPAALETAIVETAAVLSAWPLPPRANAAALEEYLVLAGSAAEAKLRGLVRFVIEPLIEANRAEFLRLAPALA